MDFPIFRNVKSVLRTGQLATKIARAGEWWGYKVASVLATGYATVGLFNQPLWPLAPYLLLLTLALTIGAIYVSILNDWTDRADDQLAGKTNRLATKSTLFFGTILSLFLVGGLCLAAYFWQLSPLGSLLYLGSCAAYSLYSLPPVRLKIRGLAGVLADALGAHLFPNLFVVSLIGYWSGQSIPLFWWIAVGSWSLACGIRNILKHQLGDAAADKQAGVQTLVVRWGERRAHRLGIWVAFPIEVLALGGMLLMLDQRIPILFLLFYLGLERLRARFWQIHPVILDPNQRILFDEYYSTFFPLALLLTQCLRYPGDTYVLVLHCLLFGWHAIGTVREASRLLITALHRVSRQFN
ncbi:UbiA family prenyltransferase [Spirosoma validum]|uniref:UbiA family prenyltransferase n=1 Tax=Spirosoma validum TaxID=2771355 RepID=A0A927AZE2_9BACT|nr:UbiA family prenyltransferase [Spirosoma validum]MBD2752593.1 UbiA family prenyltransferase [Spirosoma validum]